MYDEDCTTAPTRSKSHIYMVCFRDGCKQAVTALYYKRSKDGWWFHFYDQHSAASEGVDHVAFTAAAVEVTYIQRIS